MGGKNYEHNFLLRFRISVRQDVSIKKKVLKAYHFCFGCWNIPLGTYWLEGLLGFKKAKPAFYMNWSFVLSQLFLPRSISY